MTMKWELKNQVIGSKHASYWNQHTNYLMELFQVSLQTY